MRLLFAVSCAASVAACQWIPGTEANQAEEAKTYVTQALRDPASAEFRDVRVGRAKEKDGGPESMVCGEVNAKNAMGGYAGFARFVAATDSKSAIVDPQFEDGERRHQVALDLCSLRKDRECSGAREIAEKTADQAGFNAMWDHYCTAK